MKRILPLIFSASVLMFACKKEETQQQPEPQYTIVDLPFNIQVKHAILPNGNLLIFDGNLVCVSQSGQIVWQKNLPNFQHISEIAVGNDGSIYLCGHKYTSQANVDICIVKCTATGDIVWEKTFGGTSSDYATDIVSLPDGNMLVMGQANSFSFNDTYVIKIAATDGSAIWENNITSPEVEQMVNLTPCADGGALLLLGINSALGTRCVRVNAQGQTQWVHNLTLPNIGGASFVKETSIGEFLLCGRISQSTNPGNNDLLVYKLDATGQLIWSTTAGMENNNEEGYCITENTNGGFMVVGWARNPAEITQGILVKLSSAGEKEKTEYFGPTNYSSALTIFNNPIDAGYLITGYIITKDDSLELAIPSLYIARLDSNGDFIY